MKLKYFSWIRERIGVGEEDVELPDGVTNLEEMLSWLCTRGDGYELALENREVVRIALDMVHVNDLTLPVSGVREIAFFPPMTGG